MSPAFRAVLEAGSRKFSGESQDFHRRTTVGDHYFDLDIARLRFMGGSSNHWAGWCRVLDSQDFEPKAWAPDPGAAFSPSRCQAVSLAKRGDVRTYVGVQFDSWQVVPSQQ